MPDSPATRVARFPGAAISAGSFIPSRSYLDIPNQLAFQRDQLAIDSRVDDYADADFLTSDGATTTSTVVEIDAAAGFGRVAGVMASVAALADQEIVGAGQWIYSALLDGEEPAMIADGNGVEVALCLTLISGGLQLVTVFGAEVLTATPPAAPTGQEIRDALALAAVRDTDPLTGLDPDAFVVVGRFSLNRSGTTITQVHADASTDDDLKAERLRGYSLAGSV